MSLVFNRRKGQEVIIDEHIKISVVAAQGGYATLRIDAPKHIPVDRSEVFLDKQRRRERRLCAQKKKDVMAKPQGWVAKEGD